MTLPLKNGQNMIEEHEQVREINNFSND